MKKLIMLLMVALLGVVSSNAIVHTVARGENLQNIAAAYGVTTEAIIEANPDCIRLFYVGLKLQIPENRPAQAPQSVQPAQQYQPAQQEQQYQPAQQSQAAQSSYSNQNTTVAPVAQELRRDDPAYRIDSDGNPVYHSFYCVAQYQIGDFDFAKESGFYGLGMVVSSFSHWGRFHLGFNINLSINAGLVDDWGMDVDFGPSMRVDISKHVFVNMPIDAVCVATFPDGGDTQTDWGAKIAPSLNVFATDRFGLFVGPQVMFSFSGDSDATFGLVAGLSYAF